LSFGLVFLGWIFGVLGFAFWVWDLDLGFLFRGLVRIWDFGVGVRVWLEFGV
jgi:hypothetical protein